MMNLPQKSKLGFTQRDAIAESSTIPAPIGGLNTRDAEAAMRPVYATLMENFWPEARFVGIRGGAEIHNQLESPVKQLGSWNGPVGEEMWAFVDGGAYNVTAPSPAVPTLGRAFTNGEMLLSNYSTSGGTYLIGVNGVDDYFYYKSPTWTSVANFPIVNGTPGEVLLTKNISSLAAHQRTLFFIEKDSMNFYFLPINSITGSVNRFPLGGLFRKGGKLAAIGSWTIDSAEGPDDLAVFLTTEGQIAVYGGTDPTSALSWTLRGIFDVGQPLGQTPMFKLGGDLLILTTYGLTSLSKLLKEGWTSSKTTLTDIISSYFQATAKGFESSPEWRITADPKLSLLLINCPGDLSRPRRQLAMNLSTGAWTVFKGWQTTSWLLFKGQLYAGDGKKVGKMWTTSGDYGKRLSCYVRGAWTYLTPRARTKQVNLLRFLVRLAGEIKVAGGLDTDFEYKEDFYDIQTLTFPISRWDEDIYGGATFGALEKMQLDWLTIPASEGYCLAPRLRVFSGDAIFQWSAVDFTYTKGGLVG